MLIIIHVVLALSSLLLASFNLLRPARNRMNVSYCLAVATLVSGGLLIIVNHASVLRTCMSGLLFFVAVTAMNLIAARSLAAEKSK